MDSNILEEFIALSITRNYGATARQLHLSQSTLSRHISLLEKELGGRLFNRTTPLTLTPMGKAAVPYIQTITETTHELLERVSELRNVEYQTVLVQDVIADWAGNVLSLCEKRLVDAHQEYVFAHREIQPGKDFFELVRTGGLDVAFLYTFDDSDAPHRPPNVPDGCAIQLVPAFGGVLRLMLAADNPLLQVNPSSIADFKDALFITPTEKAFDSFRRSFSDYCFTYGGFTPQFDYREIDVHRNFYHQPPGSSVYIYSKPIDGENRMFPSWLSNAMVAVDLPECAISTWALYTPDAEHGAALDLVNELAGFSV